MGCGESTIIMYRVTREIAFCYGNRLLNYDGKCRHLHGHNGRAVITLAAPKLDPLGMVVDFTDVKRVIGKWVDDTLDHKMILHENDPVIPELKRLGEPFITLKVNPTAERLRATRPRAPPSAGVIERHAMSARASCSVSRSMSLTCGAAR